jgi:xanthine dehydrogenase YagR molybdenum-binding subunit
VRYEVRPTDLQIEGVGTLPANGGRTAAETARRDADAALSQAPIKINAIYRIARENHNPMEPHATVAAWDGDRLNLWSKSQFVVNEQAEITAVFGLPADHVRMTCPFVGGAFGTTLRTWPHVTIAAIAARHVHRPIKLVLTRKQMFHTTGYRPCTIQRIALGAGTDGRVRAIVHEGTSETSRYEQFVESLTSITSYLYTCPDVRSSYRLAPADTSTPTYMRAPGEASGMFALECAMDELAVALNMNPVALRLVNEPAVDEGENRPFSSRSLKACLEQGAARFGWSRRDPRPGAMRDGHLLIGLGMASTTYPAFQAPAGARVRLRANGPAEVETASSDMGPGTYTSMTQVAADALGMDPEQVAFQLGRSDFPATPPHGGSMTMASVGSAVQAACLAAREKAVQAAIADSGSPLFGIPPGDIEAADGRLFTRTDPSRSETYAGIVARHGIIEAEATSNPDENVQKQFSTHSFGAVFTEVAVDSALGTVRVRRAIGAYGCGRIINPRLAHSQCIGGMVGGIGMALMEQTLLDPRDGRPVNASLADYLVPVNLDVDVLDAIFVEEHDPHINSLGVKGLAEIALVGIAPAIANAVFHATGKRIRALPIRSEDLI